MKHLVRKGAFFAKAEGAPTWRDRLAKMKLGGADRKATAILEIDDANGETLIFPEIGDVSEIAMDVTVTATDGAHVVAVDGKTFTIDIMAGKVVSVIEEMPAGPGAEMNAETAEFIGAVAEALGEHEEFKTSATALIEAQAQTIATMQEDFKKFKATMGHGSDEDEEQDETKKKIVIGKKSIDFAKINLK
jgi:hypothetical protein